MPDPTTPADRIRGAITTAHTRTEPTPAEDRVAQHLLAAVPTVRARLGLVDFRAVVKAALSAGQVEALDSMAQQASPRSRSTDPATSRAACGPTFGHGSHLARLLGQWVATGAAMTSEQAADLADLQHAEYAKRASDLHRLGLIETVTDPDGGPVTRVGAAGRDRLVYRSTEAGRAYYATLRPKNT